jgi:hypothetical protein
MNMIGESLRFPLAYLCLFVLVGVECMVGEETIIATLVTPKTIFQGEPLTVTLQIKNVSTVERYILIPEIRRFGPDTILFHIWTANAGQNYTVKRPDIYIGGMKIMPPSLLPIQKISRNTTAEYSFTLIYDFPDIETRRRLFDKPGQYSIQATIFELSQPVVNVCEVPYDVPRRSIMTPVSPFEVVVPNNPREKEALEAFLSLPDEYLIYEPFVFRSDCHVEAVKCMKTFFQNYADTYLGQRASLVLGIAVADGVINDDAGAIQKTIELISRSDRVSERRLAIAILEKMVRRK